MKIAPPLATAWSAGCFLRRRTRAMAAALLHVHVEYLRRMVREGRIPAHRHRGSPRNGCPTRSATALCVTVRGPLPAHMAAVLDLSECPGTGPLELRTEGDAILVGRIPWSRSDPLIRFAAGEFDGT